MNGWCEYVQDGVDTDGTAWYRCTTHDELAPSDAAPCAGYIEIPYEWHAWRHPVFINDEGFVPVCDICNGPQRTEGDDWNGETGNHYSCEETNPDYI